jgi:hypothetical protein
VTHAKGAIKAQSTAGVVPPASIGNAEGVLCMGSPSGHKAQGVHPVVAGSLRAHSTRPSQRLGLYPLRLVRVSSNSVNRP